MTGRMLAVWTVIFVVDVRQICLVSIFAEPVSRTA